MPAVLKMERQINHANWPLRALFHMAILLHTPSQIARRIARQIMIIREVFI
jgi:hypothetical protein